MKFCTIPGARLSSEQLDLSNVFETEGAKLDLVFTSANRPCSSHCMHCCASLIDKQQSFLTAVLGNTFACGWSAQSLYSASEKF